MTSIPGNTITESSHGNDLLPVRMLNEYVYCPRLFHLMHVEGRWEDHVYTIEGRQAHRRVEQADSLATLLGLEGRIAAIYFQHFTHMLKPRDFDPAWDFAARNRRPPRDPVNALLSFGYALLVKECAIAPLSEGLDPWWGLYHQPRHGRPALALDLMEPFRPTIVDSAVITAINTGMVLQRHFLRSKAGCLLQPEGRKSFLQAYESRLDQFVTHPVFDYRCSWRTVIHLQARLLARWLRGDVPSYTSITTR